MAGQKETGMNEAQGGKYLWKCINRQCHRKLKHQMPELSNPWRLTTKRCKTAVDCLGGGAGKEPKPEKPKKDRKGLPSLGFIDELQEAGEKLF